MNNIYTREYTYCMTFSHLSYISVRDKGTLVRVKLQVNHERRNFFFQTCLEIIVSYSYHPEYNNPIYGLMYNRACEF